MFSWLKRRFGRTPQARRRVEMFAARMEQEKREHDNRLARTLRRSLDILLPEADEETKKRELRRLTDMSEVFQGRRK